MSHQLSSAKKPSSASIPFLVLQQRCVNATLDPSVLSSKRRPPAGEGETSCRPEALGKASAEGASSSSAPPPPSSHHRRGAKPKPPPPQQRRDHRKGSEPPPHRNPSEADPDFFQTGAPGNYRSGMPGMMPPSGGGGVVGRPVSHSHPLNTTPMVGRMANPHPSAYPLYGSATYPSSPLPVPSSSFFFSPADTGAHHHHSTTTGAEKQQRQVPLRGTPKDRAGEAAGLTIETPLRPEPLLLPYPYDGDRPTRASRGKEEEKKKKKKEGSTRRDGDTPAAAAAGFAPPSSDPLAVTAAAAVAAWNLYTAAAAAHAAAAAAAAEAGPPHHEERWGRQEAVNRVVEVVPTGRRGSGSRAAAGEGGTTTSAADPRAAAATRAPSGGPTTTAIAEKRGGGSCVLYRDQRAGEEDNGWRRTTPTPDPHTRASPPLGKKKTAHGKTGKEDREGSPLPMAPQPLAVPLHSTSFSPSPSTPYDTGVRMHTPHACSWYPSGGPSWAPLPCGAMPLTRNDVSATWLVPAPASFSGAAGGVPYYGGSPYSLLPTAWVGGVPWSLPSVSFPSVAASAPRHGSEEEEGAAAATASSASRSRTAGTTAMPRAAAAAYPLWTPSPSPSSTAPCGGAAAPSTAPSARAEDGRMAEERGGTAVPFNVRVSPSLSSTTTTTEPWGRAPPPPTHTAAGDHIRRAGEEEEERCGRRASPGPQLLPRSQSALREVRPANEAERPEEHDAEEDDEDDGGSGAPRDAVVAEDLPAMAAEVRAEIRHCRGTVCTLARTLDGKRKLQRLLRRARRVQQQLLLPTPSASSPSRRATSTVVRDEAAAPTSREDHHAPEEPAMDAAEDVVVVVHEIEEDPYALLSDVVDLMLKELRADVANMGLDEHGCHILKAAIAHCRSVRWLQKYVVAPLSETSILNWCAATHYSRSLVEALFAKEATWRQSEQLLAAPAHGDDDMEEDNNGRSKKSSAAQRHPLTAPLMRAMVKNAMYLAVMQQGCLCFSHCYAKYCTAAQQRAWLLMEEEEEEESPRKIQNSHAVRFSRWCPLLKDLAVDCYGNYTVQCLLRHTLDRALMRECAREFLLPHVVPLALHKHGSNVVEALIEVFGPTPAFPEPSSSRTRGGGKGGLGAVATAEEGGSETPPAPEGSALEAEKRRSLGAAASFRRALLLQFGLLPPRFYDAASASTRPTAPPPPAAVVVVGRELEEEEEAASTAVLDQVISNGFGNFVIRALLTHLFPTSLLRTRGGGGGGSATMASSWSGSFEDGGDEWPTVQRRCRAALQRSQSPYASKLERWLQR